MTKYVAMKMLNITKLKRVRNFNTKTHQYLAVIINITNTNSADDIKYTRSK
jgi:hypothetical protein